MDPVPDVNDLWPNFSWLMWEVEDLFGINQKNLVSDRMLLPEFFKGFPLRKDFPLTGYVELRYNEELKQIPGVIQIADEVPWGLNTFYVYNIQVDQRDELLNFLDNNNIGTNIHFRYPVHASPAFAKWTKSLPVTESVANNIISLPSSQHLTEEQQLYIIQKIAEFYKYSYRKRSFTSYI